MRVRTGYSFRTAVGFLDEVNERLRELGWGAAPITDRASTFGFARWNSVCSEHGVRPVFGVELGVVAVLGEARPTLDYWTFVAQDDLRPLHDLIRMATQPERGLREPKLDYREVRSVPGLIKISGERARWDHFDPAEDIWVGVSPAMSLGGLRAAREAGHTQFVAQSDNNYTRADDKELYRVALGQRAFTQTYPQHLLSDEEWAQAVWHLRLSDAELQDAVAARGKLLEQSTASLRKATLFKPRREKTLRAMCLEGAARLGLELNETYVARMDRELAMIEEKDYEDYFYIIADMVQWAKQRMVVGPARGSSCGSLVCYLLDITAIDPIPYDLIFERFIDVNRSDLPDIDIDFSDQRRQMVFDYATAKYGSERVARLGTVSLFKPRSALKQAGMSLQIPQWRVNKVLDGVIERSGGDSRALQQLEDTLKETEAGRDMLKAHPEVAIAGRMEGHPNTASQHAAGVVITSEPLADYVAVDGRTNAVMCDKYDAEEYNLLKIDALGLTQLSIFERTLQLIGKKDVSGWLETLPTDDPAAFEVINKGHFGGIFQFAGASLQSLCKQFTLTCLEDVVSVTALARPGPMATGGANSWVKRKAGREKVEYPHPIFEPYLKGTLGIVMYQEQVLTIGREIGDLSWAEVTLLRKAMSKSLGKEYFDQWGDKWKANAAAKGVPEPVLEKVWDDLCAYGSWAFNRSHAVAYGIVSYWCMWLKAHHPLEFAAATLDAEKDAGRQIYMLRELEQEGVNYVSVDSDHSGLRWEIAPDPAGGRRLVGPLTAIKGIGPSKVGKILNCRATGEELPKGILKLLENAETSLDTLYPVRDAVAAIDLKALKIVSKPTPVIDVQCGVNGKVVVFAVIKKIAPKDENEQVNIAKRGGRRLSGPTASLNMFVADDTDEVFAKIDRFKFEAIGRPVVERGRPGKALYAIEGTVPPTFRMISVTRIRYLGDLDEIGKSE